MINEYKKSDIFEILYVINDAALKYKGIIPNDCWHEPYMTKQELVREFDDGVRMFGLKKNNELLGVMGLQVLNDVTLIRHAYTLTLYQGKGVGKSLLQHVFKINHNTCVLVGTWRKATWAIEFYKKFGFSLLSRKRTEELLKQYWKISSQQIENSVVLEK